MANTANLVYSSQGPTGSGQVFASATDSGTAAQAIEGTISFTGDASTSTVSVGYIDGTKTLPFTPSGIIAFRSGGAGTSTINALAVSSITNAGFTLTASATLTAAVYTFTIRIIR